MISARISKYFSALPCLALIVAVQVSNVSHAQSDCSVDTSLNSSQNIAKAKFRWLCPSFALGNCYETSNGAWRCVSQPAENFSSEQLGASEQPDLITSSFELNIVVKNNTLRLPSSGWYQIQDVKDLSTVYEGKGEVRLYVADGSYTVIDLKRNIRIEKLVVLSGSGSGSSGSKRPGSVPTQADVSQTVPSTVARPTRAAVTVDGNTISLPSGGWYQIQRASDHRAVYEGVGGIKKTLPAGVYDVINLKTNRRTDNLVVARNRTSPEPPLLSSNDVYAPQTSIGYSAGSNRYTVARKGPLRIFPGAEGFGTESIGGRGGRICKVTNVNDRGPGSFRACAESSGPRIVVFETGGTIEVNSSITIKHPFMSVYGQTAPGDGIMLRSSLETTEGPLHVKSHDVLLQHLRLRAGVSKHRNCCRDALLINSEIRGDVYNVVVDHNSISWGTDQISNTWYDANNITYSNNLISESMHDNGSDFHGPSGRGLLIGSHGSHNISLHHNMFTQSFQRNPMVKTSGIVDITNNLIYHWISRGGQQHSTYRGQKVNWVKNHYMAKTYEPNATVVGWGDILLISKNGNPTESYFLGNIGHNRPNDDLPEYQIANTNWGEPYDPALGYHSDKRFPAPPISEVDALELQKTLPPHVGASAPKRDTVDTRILREFARGTGKMPNCVSQDDLPGDPRCLNNVGGWPFMAAGTAPVDSDGDGIPDQWELQHGLNPRVDDSRLDSNGDGYLNIEDFALDLSN